MSSAEAKPEHVSDSEPLSKVAQGSLPDVSASVGTLCYPFSQIMNYYLSKSHLKVDFITLKCNSQKRFQNIDQVRKLVARHYLGYVIVGSPKGGRHWHVLCHREGSRTLKVPRGIHYVVSQVGTLHRSSANRRVGNSYADDATLMCQIKAHGEKAPATICSGGQSFAQHLASVAMYLLENLLENPKYSKYGNLAMRFK